MKKQPGFTVTNWPSAGSPNSILYSPLKTMIVSSMLCRWRGTTKFGTTFSGLRKNVMNWIGFVLTHMFSAKVASKSTGASFSRPPSSQ